MAFLGKGKKCDLIELAIELGNEVPEDSKIVDLRKIICQSNEYDEDFAKNIFDNIIAIRIKNEESQKLESERAFELEKLKIETASKRSLGNDEIVRDTEINKSYLELRNLIQQFSLNDGDITSYLILFERQVKRIGIKEEDYVSYLIGFLPYEISQLIAKESEQDANDYSFVKNLLLKRFKLSPEKFRQKFVNHVKDSKITWKDFVFDLRNYFDEWLAGLNIHDFNSLKELIISDQLKKKVPNVIREHFIDDWPKFIKPNDLADRLDEYENVRSGIRITPYENKNITRCLNYQYDDFRNKQRTSFKDNRNHLMFGNSSKLDSKYNSSNKFNERERSGKYFDRQKGFNSNDKYEPKCFSCNEHGHVLKNCPIPCKGCGLKGHSLKFCHNKNPQNKNDASSLNISHQDSLAPDKYLKEALINKQSVSALIDSGSSSCILKLSVAEKLKLNISRCEKDLYSFGNQIKPAVKSVGVALIDIQIDDVLAKDISVLIVPDITLPIDLLVGRTFLDLPYIAYARVGNNLHIGYAKDYPFININIENDEQMPSIKLKTSQTTEIVNNSINFVKAKVDKIDKGLIIIKGKENNLDSLLEVNHGETLIPILNVGEHKITFKENQLIGEANEIDESSLDSDLNKLYSRSEENIVINNIHERDPITQEQIKFDETLTAGQREDVVILLNEYRDCFALNLNELGCTDITSMEIKEVEGSKPVCSRRYKTNANEHNIIKQIVKDWKDCEGVKETLSPYANEVSEPEDTMTNIIENNLEVCLTLSEDEQVLIIQHADSELKKLIDIFKKPDFERSTEEKKIISNYSFKRNRLFRTVQEKGKERLLYVIPKSMRKSIAVKFHDLMGHFSVDRTVNKIKELYWFPYMKRYIRKHVSMCFECLVNKVPGGKQQGFLHPIKAGKRPFSIIHMDHLGPFVKSSRGNQDLLVMIDNLTRFVRLSAVKNTSAIHVLKSLKNFVNEFGLPDRIISDRGPCFTSHQFETYCSENGIQHTLNSTKHPQGNGMVERANRTILATISTSMEDERHKDWDLRIKETERNLNNVVNRTTNKTPFEMLHGYLPRFTDGILRRLADEDAEVWKDQKKIQEDVREEIERKQRKMKESYDKRRCRTVIFEPGEIVVVRRSPKHTGQPTKTQPKYRGPLIITETLPNDTYRITQLEEKQKGRYFTTTAHVSQLKAWRNDADDDSSSDEEALVSLSST